MLLLWLRRCVSSFLGWIHSEQDDDDVDLCENEKEDAAITGALRVDTTKASSSSWTRMPAHHHEERWVVIRPSWKLFARRAIRREARTGDTIQQNYVVRITRTASKERARLFTPEL